MSKVADMRLYGLLEPRGIKATPLAMKLTFGTEQEKQEAIEKAILNVPLWKELYDRFGTELPETNFWVQLQKITGVDHLEAQKYAETVRKAYLEDISHLRRVEQRGGTMPSSEIYTQPSIQTINIQAGAFRQTIPFTREGIELAKGFLDLLKSQLTEKEEKE